jgi:HD-GYP domain-containing protein (c-di-GMP phosphodiesterase class II)/DNA-binding CsgD family transcriptional regulator
MSGQAASADLRLADLVVGLSLVADLGMGLEPGDAARAGFVAARMSAVLDLPDPSGAYYISLLQHCGCTAFSHEAAAWLGGDDIAAKSAGARTNYSDPREVVGTFLAGLAPSAGTLRRIGTIGTAMLRSGQIRAGYSRANCEVASAIARRVGLGSPVESGLAQIFEQWDGRGFPTGLGGADISDADRCAQLAGIVALFDRLAGREGTIQAVAGRRGRSLDPVMADAYRDVSADLHAELAELDPLVAAVDAEPGAPVTVTPAQLVAVCRAFGDAVDLKSVWLHGHSSAVADLAEAAALEFGLSRDAAGRLRLAGHLHDLGRAAVPTGIWEKPRRLGGAEWERVRLHAYHTERILARCGPLADLAPLAGMHHERLDGSGYHRAAFEDAIPAPARILAAADVFQALTEDRPHRLGHNPEDAAAQLGEDVATGRLDGDAVAAVLTAAGLGAAARAGAGRSNDRRRERGAEGPSRPAGLTDRQIEVLRLLSSGLSNPEIARRLVISRRTAEHHVQDIYARIEVSSRAAAALFAMEHQLLR